MARSCLPVPLQAFPPLGGHLSRNGLRKKGGEEEDLRRPNLRKTCGASGYNTDQSNELSMPVPRGMDEGRKGRPWVSHRVSGEKVRRKGRRTGA